MKSEDKRGNLFMNSGVYLNFASVIGSFIGLVYSLPAQEPVPTTAEFWATIVERLGVPLLFLVFLMWSIIKASQKVWPFLQKQIESLIALPKEQVENERRERKEQKELYEKSLAELVKSIESLTKRFDAFLEFQIRKENKDGN